MLIKHICKAYCLLLPMSLLGAAAPTSKPLQSSLDLPLLHKAIAKQDIAKTISLITAGHDKEARDNHGNTPLHIAAYKGSIDIIKILIAAGVDKNSENLDGCTPLHMAVTKEQLEVIKILIAVDANKEAVAHNGFTPLHLAAINGLKQATITLLKLGAQKEARSKKGNTPLHMAAAKGMIEILHILLAAGANKEPRNNKGMTPLHCAAIGGCITAINVLLAAGLNKEAVNCAGWTPLHMSVMAGHTKIIECLFAAGANREARDKEGLTPLHWIGIKNDKLALTETFYTLDKKTKSMPPSLQDTLNEGNPVMVRDFFATETFKKLSSQQIERLMLYLQMASAHNREKSLPVNNPDKPKARIKYTPATEYQAEVKPLPLTIEKHTSKVNTPPSMNPSTQAEQSDLSEFNKKYISLMLNSPKEKTFECTLL